MNNQPLVTVLIPVYNRPHVTNTIKSIINQDYENLEILIVDNDSTDNTVDEIKRLNDSRIRIVINEMNMGQTYSMNRGLELASGKYIARIDSDDIAVTNRISKQVEFMENNKDYVLCGSWIRMISDDDVLGSIMKMPITNEGMCFMQTICCAMHHPTAMYRTSIIQKYEIRYDPNISMAEDYDMWRKLMHYGKALNLPEVLIYYRRGNSNDSVKHYKLMLNESRMVRRKVCDELNLNPDKHEQLNKILDISEKDKISFFQMIKYFKFIWRQFKEQIVKESEDYEVVRFLTIRQIYATCFLDNKSFWIRPLKVFYYYLKKRDISRMSQKMMN